MPSVQPRSNDGVFSSTDSSSGAFKQVFQNLFNLAVKIVVIWVHAK